MADQDKKIMLEIESNLDQYQKEAEQAGKQVRALQQELRELKKADGDNSEQIEATQTKLRKARGEYREATKAVDQIAKANKAGAGSYAELQAQLALAEKRLKTQSGLLTRNADGTIQLTDAYVQASKELEQARGAINQFNLGIHDGRTSVGLYQEGIQKALGSTGMFGKGIQGASGAVKMAIPMLGSFNGMLKLTRIALMALPFVAIAAAVAGLMQYFKRSEEGQDAWNKVMAVTRQILDRLMDILASVGEAMVNAVQRPREAWEDLQNRLQRFADFFRNTFGMVLGGYVDQFAGSFQKMIAGIQLGWHRLVGIFKDNTEAIEAAEKAVEEAEQRIVDGLKKHRQGVENITQAYRNLGQRIRDGINDINDSARAAARLADERARLDRLERQYLVENEVLRKQSAAARAEAERLKLTNARESIKMVKEAFALDEQIMKHELELIEIRTKNKREQIALNKSTKDDLMELARLEADYEKAQAAFAEQQRQRQRQLNNLRRQAFQQNMEMAKAELETEKLHFQQQIKDDERLLKSDEATYQERLMGAERIAQRKAEIARQETELEVAEIENRLELSLISEEDAARQLELIQTRSKYNLLEIEQSYRHEVDQMRKAELEMARKAAEEQERIAREAAEAEMAYRQKVVETTIAASRQMLGALSEFAEEGSAIHKAFAMADAVINTYVGVTRALAELPPPASYIAAGATIAQGMAAVRKIAQTRPGQASVSNIAQTGETAGTGFVARRAGTAIQAGNQTFANVGQNIQTGQAADSGAQRGAIDDQQKAFLEAIREIRPVVAVETIERVRRRQNQVEVSATL